MIMELPQYAPNMVKSTIRNCWYHRGTHAHARSIGRILLTTYNCQRVSRTKKSGRNAHAREREFAAHCKKCDSKVFDHLCIHKLHVYARTPNQIHTHLMCIRRMCAHIHDEDSISLRTTSGARECSSAPPLSMWYTIKIFGIRSYTHTHTHC